MGRVNKRAVKDIPIFIDSIFEELQNILRNFKEWNYKNPTADLRLRDKALFAALILIGIRASEIKLQKKQFLVKPDEVVLVNVKTLKRGLIRPQIILPRSGRLGFFTEIFLTWLTKVPTMDSYVFPKATTYGDFLWDKPLSRKRIWQIINHATGLFPHWFRGVHETIYGRIVFKRDAWKLKEFMGYRSIQSTEPYVRGEMEPEDKQRLKTL